MTIYKALFVPHQSSRHLKNLYTSNVAFSTGTISAYNLLQLFFSWKSKKGQKRAQIEPPGVKIASRYLQGLKVFALVFAVGISQK
jgi:hypothetical protein